MGRKTTGLRNRHGIWHIEKQVLGQKIHESTGTGNLKEAELVLAHRVEEIRQAKIFGVRKTHTFRDGATRYLEENMHLATISNMALYLRQLDPYIGHLPLNRVYLETLQPFIDARKKDGVKNKTINLALSVARRVLNLSARLWRDEEGHTWLETAPLIQLLPLHDQRQPYPINWDEQRALFQQLPNHLARMCLFNVNTGTREQEVCKLRWDMEIEVPELGTSVFIIPGNLVKNREDRLIVLNRIGKSVIEEVRGMHDEYVFCYKGKPLQNIYNSAWKRARERSNLTQVRLHDLKHTFGRRLRAAGVSLETRKVLLGHKNGDITSHYSAPELEELIRAVNKVCGGKFGKSPALTLLKTKAATR